MVMERELKFTENTSFLDLYVLVIWSRSIVDLDHNPPDLMVGRQSVTFVCCPLLVQLVQAFISSWWKVDIFSYGEKI